VDIFDPAQADLVAPRSRLQELLSKDKVVSGSLQQISSSIQKNVADSLPPLDPMQDPAIAASLPSYVQGLKSQVTHYVSLLSDLPNNFTASVEAEINVILQKFDRENRDHFGRYQTDRHVDELIQQFQMEVAFCRIKGAETAPKRPKPTYLDSLLLHLAHRILFLRLSSQL
jgi:hypothetical protein